MYRGVYEVGGYHFGHFLPDDASGYRGNVLQEFHETTRVVDHCQLWRFYYRAFRFCRVEIAFRGNNRALLFADIYCLLLVEEEKIMEIRSGIFGYM